MQYDQNAIREAMKIAQTPAGQELLRHLQASQGTTLQKAMDSAAAGDYSAAKQMLRVLLQNPDAQKLLRQMGGSNGSDGR